METALQFMNRTYNKTYDMDGYYGAQCWDYFAYLCSNLGYKIINCTDSGYVRDIWNQRKSNGVLKDYVEIPKDKMKMGDVVIFKVAPMTPESHIGLYNVEINKKSFTLMGQNQYGIAKVNNGTFNYEDILGVLRPKCWDTTVSLPIPKSGTVTALFDKIRVRTAPNLTNDSITDLWYDTGMKLNYSNIVTGDGWYWLTYTSKDGHKRYIAYATMDLKTVYWK